MRSACRSGFKIALLHLVRIGGAINQIVCIIGYVGAVSMSPALVVYKGVRDAKKRIQVFY